LEQKVASMTPEQGWWLDLLMAGRLPGREGGIVAKRRLFDDYVEHAGKVGDRHRSTETMLGLFIHKAVPGLRSCRDHSFTEERDGETRRYRANAYRFPSLHKCREAMGHLLQQQPEWDDREVWENRHDREEHANDDAQRHANARVGLHLNGKAAGA
jgi:hypothetical protein